MSTSNELFEKRWQTVMKEGFEAILKRIEDATKEIIALEFDLRNQM